MLAFLTTIFIYAGVRSWRTAPVQRIAKFPRDELNNRVLSDFTNVS